MDQIKKALSGQKVLVTGHTGFKGSWLSLWLHTLGADVVGYSLPPPSPTCNFSCLNLADKLTHIEGDVRDYPHLAEVMQQQKPTVVFHLAAQPIVLHSYHNPKETFDTNAGGTVNILEAARTCSSVKAIVVITTDKCYENNGWTWGYRENDALGGHDPYSTSKSMAELAVQSYQRSFFHCEGPAVASARAGNVIGGGDFSEHRIVPDCFRALFEGRPIPLRNPNSVRPWLYVLDPLYGYMLLAAKLLDEKKSFASPWNFGPLESDPITTKHLVERVIVRWGSGSWEKVDGALQPEMELLRLNWDKAAHKLGWKPQYNWNEAVDATVSWYQGFKNNHDLYELCLQQIAQFEEKRHR